VSEGAPTRRFALGLFAAYAAWWLWLAIAPKYRADWVLENVLVLVALPILSRVWRDLSRGAILALFVFLLLHAVGAHYTYAEVPYDHWAKALTGHSINALFGLERNHFDRLVHFLYGLLVTPAAFELLGARAGLRGGWRRFLCFMFMAAQASCYEVIEWGAAEVFGGDLGQAYLGTQGDEWDSQKDSGLMVLGTLVALAALRVSARQQRPGPPRGDRQLHREGGEA
jgi:putative membrane protein